MKTKCLKSLRKTPFYSKVMVLLLLCIAMATPGIAKESRQLTLTQAIKIAITKNPGLKQMENQVRTGEISVDQKKADFLPELNFSANSSRWYGKNQESPTGLFENQKSTSLNMSISANLNLFKGFYDQASLQQSQLQASAAEASYARYKQSIIFETLQRFLAVITTGEYTKIEKENLKTQRLQLQRIEDFVQAGRRPKTDLFQQKAEIASSEYRLLNSQRNFKVAKLQLMQTLGLEPRGELEIIDPGVDKLVNTLDQIGQGGEIEQAYAQRPDIEAQRYQVEASKKGIKAARSGYFPRISLFADLATNYSSRNDVWSLEEQLFTNNLNTTVGLSLSIPIFDKYKTKNSLATAKINHSTQKLELEKLKNQVNVEVQEALEDYRTSAKQVQTAARNMSYTQAALESIQDRYNVNAATMLELTQGRTQHLQARYNYVEAKFTSFVKGMAVLYVQGDSESLLAMLNSNI